MKTHFSMYQDSNPEPVDTYVKPLTTRITFLICKYNNYIIIILKISRNL